MKTAVSLSCPGSATFEGMASPSSSRHLVDDSADEGPFRADQLHDGDNYELSNGHAILCMGASDRHGTGNAQGAMVINSDPDLEEGAGVDVGFSFNDGKNLRAPDIAAGNLSGKAGWAKGAPPLAIEYADRGQNEEQLQKKIAEFLSAGTLYVWVVRLVGPLRVEVYQPGKRKVVVSGDKELVAKGVLKNPVPVRALVDRKAANQATLRNLLNQMGYESLEAVREEGLSAGRAEGLSAGRAEGLSAGRAEGLSAGRAEGLSAGRAEGLSAGRAEGLRQAIYDVCELLSIKLSKTRHAQVERMGHKELLLLREHLKRERAWPSRK